MKILPRVTASALNNFLLYLSRITAFAGFGIIACSSSPPTSGTNPPPIQNEKLLINVSSTHLPSSGLSGNSMDARPADLDNDGDLDIVVATEFGTNVILINDGTGKFTNESAQRLPQVVHDSEDIAIEDFDKDNDLDIIFVSEDDQTNEYYLNNGSGVFTEANSRFPTAGTTNGIIAGDVDNDGDMDVLLANAGQNVIMINDGNGTFTDETSQRIPSVSNTTQDMELGDIDNDGDLDVLVGNEDQNQVLINDGQGVFTDETQSRLPLLIDVEQTREADFGDIDNDGDLDIFFANVRFGNTGNPQDRLLINDGSGNFTDVSERLPSFSLHSVDGDFADIDDDGDSDLMIITAFGNNLFQVLLNNGSGTFTDNTSLFLPPGISGSGIDIEAADFNNDGVLDLYLCRFGGSDFLLLGQK